MRFPLAIATVIGPLTCSYAAYAKHAPKVHHARQAAPASVNPTAVPLASIVSFEASSATIPVSTFPPGSQVTSIPGAPGLPNPSSINSANFPALDKVPPIDSPQVQKWIQEVANSGVSIPDIPPTVAGGCPANTAAAANTSRCWWTCGGCTRDTDVVNCPDKLHWGLTYDDGPSPYSPNLLQYLAEVNLKATFFVVGSRVVSYPDILQAEHMAGNEIGVHTWSHPALTTLSNEEIIAELGWTKFAVQSTLGLTPKTMRPPFGDIDDRVRAICKAMDLTPVMWSPSAKGGTFDTKDFEVHAGTVTSQEVLDNWNAILAEASSRDQGFVVLEHDLFEETVQLATGYILPQALAKNPPFTIEPVITCLGQPLGNSYAETSGNTSNGTVGSSSGSSTGTGNGSSPSGGTSPSGAVEAFRLGNTSAFFLVASFVSLIGCMVAL